MTLICENVKCREMFNFSESSAGKDDAGFFVECPACGARNELMDEGLPGGPLQLSQRPRTFLPHKVNANAVPLADGRYAAQLNIRRAMGLNGPFDVPETFDIGTFESAWEAVNAAKVQAAGILGVHID